MRRSSRSNRTTRSVFRRKPALDLRCASGSPQKTRPTKKSVFKLGVHDVERERRRVRHVEALDRARKVEAGDMIAGLAGELPQSLALGAEHQRERCTERQRREIVVAAGIETDHQEAALL